MSREFSREYKVAAVKRVQAGEAVARVAEELGVRRKLIYAWKQRLEQYGEESLQLRGGRPRSSPSETKKQRTEKERIAALERLVGKQQALLDFFGRALQAVEQLPEVQAGKAPSTKASGKHESKRARR